MVVGFCEINKLVSGLHSSIRALDQRKHGLFKEI